MKWTAYVVITLSTILLPSWNMGHYNSIAKVSWLIGSWQMKTPKGYIYESWRKVSQNELSGKSYMLKESDTVIFETLQIMQRDDSLFYVPTVREQNGGAPVSFALKSISNRHFIFENVGHDFPQIISYHRIGKDSLLATISGKQNGLERIEDFPMKKIK